MIGEIIKRRREEADMSLYYISRQTGLGITQIRNIEEGKTNPSIEVANRLLSCFGLTLIVAPISDGNKEEGRE